MKRSFGGIQFEFVDGMWWRGPDGLKLLCATTMRGRLSTHWSVWKDGECLGAGMSAIEVVNLAKSRPPKGGGFNHEGGEST